MFEAAPEGVKGHLREVTAIVLVIVVKDQGIGSRTKYCRPRKSPLRRLRL